MNLGTLAIVKVLAPIDVASWNTRDVERTGAALYAMRDLKFIAARRSRHQRPRNRAHNCLIICRVTENRQCVESVTHQTKAQRIARGEIPPPDGAKAGDWFPL